MCVRRVVLMAAAIAAAVYGGGHAPHTNEFPFAAAAAAGPGREAGQVGFQAFHDRLAPYGQWLNDSRWGPVWRPNIRHGFSPYRQGHWDMTTEYGTIFVSDFPWGDIPFHYGRWFYNPERGWLWVPGYVWAPAWVIWRAGEGKIGWLPIPPWVDYEGSGTFPDDWNDGYGYAEYGISPSRFASLWCFVDARDLYAPNLDYFVIGPGDNARFIDRTQGWTRYGLRHGHVADLSLEPARYRATFGFRMPRANDFENRKAPLGGHRKARQIARHEHGKIALPAPDKKEPAIPPVAAQPVSPRAPMSPAARVPAAPAPHPPVSHPPPTIRSTTPRIYTHTEVVPYHPDSSPPPKKPSGVVPPP